MTGANTSAFCARLCVIGSCVARVRCVYLAFLGAISVDLHIAQQALQFIDFTTLVVDEVRRVSHVATSLRLFKLAVTTLLCREAKS